MIAADKNNLYKHVEFLTTLRPFRTYLNLESLRQVTDYISAEMDSFDLEVSEQN